MATFSFTISNTDVNTIKRLVGSRPLKQLQTEVLVENQDIVC